MKGTFSEIISASAEWTKTVLFRPFNMKKWVSLLFIGLFAFQMQGGCNMNLNFGGDGAGAARFTFEQLKEKFDNIKRNAEYRLSAGTGSRKTLSILLSIIAALILALVLLTQWFYSVFSFAFIDAIVANEYSMKELFRRNKTLGNSYFGWNFIMLCAFVLLIALLWKSGYVSLLGSSAGIGPFVAIALIFLITGGFLAVLINDYTLIVMFKTRMTILKAIPVAAGMIASNAGSFFKYLFVKIGLCVATAIMGGILTAVAAITLIIPLIALLGVSILFFKMLPTAAKPIFIGVGGALAVPLVTALIIFLKLILLPFAVFMKTFNIKFIARLDEKYDLFDLSKQKGAV